ncbi:MAG: RnfABCDGE type electron transport complex subunit B [Candidatus Saganbacteria bacterium]|nr:RnfABCDGE type electron transport complex subunit B [Candidatus Saganbacteria bacterium]
MIDINIIINAILLMGILGAFSAFMISIASKVFHVALNPKVEAINQILPGANCGACGAGGCTDYAEKAAKGLLPINACRPGGAKVASAIAQILGIEEAGFTHKKAVVHCGANETQRIKRAEYAGIPKCREEELAVGGYLECTYGCLGFGDCYLTCPFDAITMIEGLPKINFKKCTGCGKCVSACPRNIISLEKYDEGKPLYAIACSSKDKGSVTRKICPVGCIKCKICEYKKATDQTPWQTCVEKCPTKCIVKL